MVKQAKTNGRSKITNGTLLPDVDGRSVWARRMRDLYVAHVNDLGGIEATSEAERSLARRAATLEVELERRETAFALAGHADPADLDVYARISGTLARLLERVGIERKPRDVTPKLADYIASKAATKPPILTAASTPMETEAATPTTLANYVAAKQPPTAAAAPLPPPPTITLDNSK